MSTPITAPTPTVRRAAMPTETARRQAAVNEIIVRGLDFFYGRAQALHGISLDIPERVVMAFIGRQAAASPRSAHPQRRTTLFRGRASKARMMDGEDITLRHGCC